MAMVSSTDFLRASERPTAIATLNRQRHLTPSCGGSTPTAERTVGPARISLESLTPRPGIREQNRRKAAGRLQPRTNLARRSVWESCQFRLPYTEDHVRCRDRKHHP